MAAGSAFVIITNRGSQLSRQIARVVVPAVVTVGLAAFAAAPSTAHGENCYRYYTYGTDQVSKSRVNSVDHIELVVRTRWTVCRGHVHPRTAIFWMRPGDGTTWSEIADWAQDTEDDYITFTCWIGNDRHTALYKQGRVHFDKRSYSWTVGDQSAMDRDPNTHPRSRCHGRFVVEHQPNQDWDTGKVPWYQDNYSDD
jgi:hypothetical protein